MEYYTNSVYIFGIRSWFNLLIWNNNEASAIALYRRSIEQ